MRFSKIVLLSSIIYISAGFILSCEKELPTYEAPKEKYRQQINDFLKMFFQTNPAIRAKEPAAGLWIADQASLKAFVGKRFMEQSQEEGLSKQVIENRLAKLRMFIRVSAGQLLMVNFGHGGDLSPPQEGRFKLVKNAGGVRSYKGSFRPKQDKDGKMMKPHPFTFQLKKGGEEFHFEDKGNTVMFKREHGLPLALYETYKQSADKMKETVEF